MSETENAISEFASPGEMLGEALAERVISVKEFARASHIPERELRGLMGRKPWKLSRKTARKLQATLGIPDHLWLQMERMYRMEQRVSAKIAALLEVPYSYDFTPEAKEAGLKPSGDFVIHD